MGSTRLDPCADRQEYHAGFKSLPASADKRAKDLPMRISADSFREIIERMSQPPGGAERRTSPRMAIEAKVAIISEFASVEKPVNVLVRDVSTKGVGFEHEFGLAAGSTFLLLLPTGQDRLALSVLCIVRQVRKLGERQFSIGAEFRQVLGLTSTDGADARRAEAA
jgi:hypothetical protein